MNASAPVHTIVPLATVPSWQDARASIVVGGGTAPVKAWAAEDWQGLVDLWSRGVGARELEARFVARGYSAHEIRLLRILIFTNPHILGPLDRALFILGGLGRRDESAAGFSLHGRAARAVEVVDAANRILASLALPLIRYPNAGEA